MEGTGTPNRFVNKFVGKQSPTKKGTETPNRFANEFTVGCACSPTKKETENIQFVTDVHWYPDKYTLVIEKSNNKKLIVDFSDIIQTDPKLNNDIKVLMWNPTTEQYTNVTLAKKDDDYTSALQKIVANIASPTGMVFNNNVKKLVQQIVDDKFVWNIWENDSMEVSIHMGS